MSEVSTSSGFSPETIKQYQSLQRLLYDAVDDVKIKFRDGQWFCFCPSVEQTIIATLLVSRSLSLPPRGLDAVVVQDHRTLHGFACGEDFFVFHQPEGSTHTRIDTQEVRELVAEHIGFLARFCEN